MLYSMSVEIRGFSFDSEDHHEYLEQLPFVASAMQIEGFVTLEVEAEAATPAAAVLHVERVLRGAPFEFVRFSLELVTATEIAQRSGVTRQAVQQWVAGKRGKGFPEPYTLIGTSRVWSWYDVASWLISEGKADEVISDAPPVPAHVLERMNGALAKRRCVDSDGWPASVEDAAQQDIVMSGLSLVASHSFKVEAFQVKKPLLSAAGSPRIKGELVQHAR